MVQFQCFLVDFLSGKPIHCWWWVLKYYCIISPLRSISICLIYFSAWVLGVYMIVVSWYIDPFIIIWLCPITIFGLNSILSDISVAKPTLIWFPPAWNVIFHPFTLSLRISLELKWSLVGSKKFGLVLFVCMFFYLATLPFD